eukprot:jgi/Chrzof1/14306/Cz08g32120.t1
MSSPLRELIRAVRACKTAAEERDVVAKESAALREAFREQDPRYRHRNVAKLMYIHMLGYPTHFGQMETLKLIAANGFPEKRMGYLGLMILLDERQEVLMLVTNSLKMDLNNHKNQYIVGLALAALGNICSAEMARDLAPDVERLLESSNPYIRKKAACCAVRVLKKNPELIEQFIDKAGELVHDKNHAVMLSGVTLMLQICALDASALDKYRPMVPTLCKVLRSMLQGGFSPEHDVAGITNPFLQVKILQLLRVLGRGHADASDQMTDILAQVAANIEGNRNAGNAILYECVNTIMGIETIGGLRVMAVNILGRFLANRDNNIRYVALNTLAKVVGVDTQAVQRHRNTIVDCVKDADVSIRRRALELVYSLVNEGNIRNLTRELLDYLVVCDTEFKPDLTAKICTLIQRFAPDKRWHIDNLMQVLVQAGAYVKEEVVRALIVLITNAPELHAYAARSAFRALTSNFNTAAPSLCEACLWCIGEFGEMLPPGAGGSLLEGEPHLVVSDSDILNAVERVLKKPKQQPAVKEYALTAVMKLTARLPDQVSRCAAIIERYQHSVQLEVQQRSCEYGRIFKHDAIRSQLLERMPALDESDYYGTNLADSTAAAGSGHATSEASSTATAAAAPRPDDLLDLLGGGDTAAAAQSAPRSAVDALDDLLGAPTSTSSAAAGRGSSSGGVTPVTSQGAADLLDLLGDAGPAPGQSTAADSLGNLLGGTTTTAPSHPTITVFDKHGIVVSFSFAKPAGQPEVTHITATYINNGVTPVTDFNLQAAVPKFMQLKLQPASGSVLPPLGAGTVTQQLHITNTMHGQKQLVMRLRISCSSGGQQLLEQTEVSNFPAGL